MLAKFIQWLADYRQQIALAVAFILVAAGCFAIGYAAASQQSAPHPKAVSAGHLPIHEAGTAVNTPILSFSRPVSIQIPAIKVNSKIIEIGKDKDGGIAIPKNGQRNFAAWYKYSPAPGEFGASIIEGHLDTFSGPSVFFNLGKLKPYDKIFIKRADNKLLTFEVLATREYDKSTFPTDLFYSGSGLGAELHLITCAGDFDQHTDGYDQNLAVYARLILVSH